MQFSGRGIRTFGVSFAHCALRTSTIFNYLFAIVLAEIMVWGVKLKLKQLVEDLGQRENGDDMAVCLG